jgi:hypothetical protein
MHQRFFFLQFFFEKNNNLKKLIGEISSKRKIKIFETKKVI